MKKAILWTVVFILVLAASILNGWAADYGAWAYALLTVPAVMAVLFWISFLKKK